MGFTQRQAAGKFTRTEADMFLEQMRDPEPDPRESVEVPTWRRYPREQVLHDIATEHLAVELRRRGCTVVEPSLSLGPAVGDAVVSSQGSLWHAT